MSNFGNEMLFVIKLSAFFLDRSMRFEQMAPSNTWHQTGVWVKQASLLQYVSKYSAVVSDL